MTEKIFNQAKELKRVGLKQSQAKQILGVSDGSIWRLYHFDTWKDYVNDLASLRVQRANNTKTAVVEAHRAVQIPLTGDPDIQPDNVVNVLKGIHEELHLLRLAWEASPKTESGIWPFKKS